MISKQNLKNVSLKLIGRKQKKQRNQEEQNKKNENEGKSENVTDKLPNTKSDVIDFRNLKATDLKNNKRIVIPNPDADDEEEIRRNNVKKELEKVFVNYMNKNCDLLSVGT